MLRKDVDIDYVPISPKKPNVGQVDISDIPGARSKVRGLRELSTGSRSMPALGTPTKGLFQTHNSDGHDAWSEEHGRLNGSGNNGIRTAGEKKEILGGLLGNVDALVEGVRKAGIWGLG